MSGVSVASQGYVEPRQYLQDAYAAGARNYFDSLGYHAYTFPETPNDPDVTNAWSKMELTSPSLRSIMTANGDDGKQIWITEDGAPTNGPGTIATGQNKRVANTDHVSQDLQTTIAVQALNNTVGKPWLGAFFWYTYQDMGTAPTTNENFFGLVDKANASKSSTNVFKSFLENDRKRQ